MDAFRVSYDSPALLSPADIRALAKWRYERREMGR